MGGWVRPRMLARGPGCVSWSELWHFAVGWVRGRDWQTTPWPKDGIWIVPQRCEPQCQPSGLRKIGGGRRWKGPVWVGTPAPTVVWGKGAGGGGGLSVAEQTAAPLGAGLGVWSPGASVSLPVLHDRHGSQAAEQASPIRRGGDLELVTYFSQKAMGHEFCSAPPMRRT